MKKRLFQYSVLLNQYGMNACNSEKESSESTCPDSAVEASPEMQVTRNVDSGKILDWI